MKLKHANTQLQGSADVNSYLQVPAAAVLSQQTEHLGYKEE